MPDKKSKQNKSATKQIPDDAYFENLANEIQNEQNASSAQKSDDSYFENLAAEIQNGQSDNSTEQPTPNQPTPQPTQAVPSVPTNVPLSELATDHPVIKGILGGDWRNPQSQLPEQTEPQEQPKPHLEQLQNAVQNIKSETNNATAYLGQHILNNPPTEYQQHLVGVPFTDPNSIVNQITDPHGNPEITGQYGQYQQAVLENKLKQAKLNPESELNMYSPQATTDVQQEINDIRKATGQVVALQIGNQYLNKPLVTPPSPTSTTENPRTPKADTWASINPVQMGLDYYAAMGNPKAEQLKKALAAGKPLSQEDNLTYGEKGLDILQTSALNAASNGQTAIAENALNALPQLNQKLRKDNPQGYKERVLAQLGNQIYQDETNSNAVYRAIWQGANVTQDEVDAAAKKLGLSKEDIKDIKPEDVPKGSAVLNQLAQGFLNSTGGDAFEMTVRGLSNLAKIPLVSNLPLLSSINQQAVDDYFQPGWKERSYTGKMLVGAEPEAQHEVFNSQGINVKNLLGTMASGVGGLGGFLAGGEVAKGALEAKAALSAEKLPLVANAIVGGLQGYNSGYETANKMFGETENPVDELKKQTYSFIMGGINSAVMSIDPKLQIAEKIVGTTASKSLFNLIKEEGLEGLTQKGLANKVAEIVKETAKHTSAQALIPASITIGENVADMVYDPQGGHQLSDNVLNAATSGAISMMIPSLMAGMAHPKAQSDMNKALITDIARNPMHYQGVNQMLYDNGSISKPEYIKTNRDIPFLHKVSNEASEKVHPLTEQPFTPEERQDYITLRTQQLKLEQLAEKLPENSPERKVYDKAKSKVDAEIEDLLNQEGKYVPKPKQQVVKPVAPTVEKPQETEPTETEPKPEQKVTTEAPTEKGETVADIAKEIADEQVKKMDNEIPETPTAEQKAEMQKRHSEITADPEKHIDERLAELDQIEHKTPGEEAEKNKLEDYKKRLEEAKKREENILSLNPNQVVENKQKTPENGKGKENEGNVRNIGETNQESTENRIGQNGENANEAKNGQQEGGILNPSEVGKQEVATPEQPEKVVRESHAKYSPFQALDRGSDEGNPETEEVKQAARETPNDQPFGKTGETFNNFVDRIKKDWENFKKTAAAKSTLIAHSGVMKLIAAAEKHGWDTEKLREAYDKDKEPEAGKVITYKNEKGEDIYVVRHGETDDNIPDPTTGFKKLRTQDAPLNKSGKETAKEIADNLHQLGVTHEDNIVHSELPRATQTADIVRKELEKKNQPPTTEPTPEKPESKTEEKESTAPATHEERLNEIKSELGKLTNLSDAQKESTFTLVNRIAKNIAKRLGIPVEKYFERLAIKAEDNLPTEEPTKKPNKKAKGAIVKASEKALIVLSKTKADVTSAIHELAHDYEQVLTQQEIAALEKWSGKKFGTTAFSEAFAKGAERYIYEGTTDNKKVDNILSQFTDWFKEQLKTIATEYFKDTKELSPEAKDVYAKMFADDMFEEIRQSEKKTEEPEEPTEQQEPQPKPKPEPQQKQKEVAGSIRKLSDKIKKESPTKILYQGAEGETENEETPTDNLVIGHAMDLLADKIDAGENIHVAAKKAAEETLAKYKNTHATVNGLREIIMDNVTNVLDLPKGDEVRFDAIEHHNYAQDGITEIRTSKDPQLEFDKFINQVEKSRFSPEEKNNIIDYVYAHTLMDYQPEKTKGAWMDNWEMTHSTELRDFISKGTRERKYQEQEGKLQYGDAYSMLNTVYAGKSEVLRMAMNRYDPEGTGKQIWEYGTELLQDIRNIDANKPDGLAKKAIALIALNEELMYRRDQAAEALKSGQGDPEELQKIINKCNKILEQSRKYESVYLREGSKALVAARGRKTVVQEILDEMAQQAILSDEELAAKKAIQDISAETEIPHELVPDKVMSAPESKEHEELQAAQKAENEAKTNATVTKLQKKIEAAESEKSALQKELEGKQKEMEAQLNELRELRKSKQEDLNFQNDLLEKIEKLKAKLRKLQSESKDKIEKADKKVNELKKRQPADKTTSTENEKKTSDNGKKEDTRPKNADFIKEKLKDSRKRIEGNLQELINKAKEIGSKPCE